MKLKEQTDQFLDGLSKNLVLLVKHLQNLLKEKDEQLIQKYRVVDFFNKNNMTYCKIQIRKTRLVVDYKTSDILADDELTRGFSPEDIRTIANLANFDKYGKTQRDVNVNITVTENGLTATYSNGDVVYYDLSLNIDLSKIESSRVSYMLGCMKTEKIMKEASENEPFYRIINDNISTLTIENKKTGEVLVRNPIDILFSEQCKLFAKEDIARIGYICGQMSLMNGLTE